MDDLIKRKDAILMIQRHGVGCFDADEFHPEEAERFVIGMLEKLPSAEPEIIYCGECAKMKVDTVFHDCWCGETGKKVWVNHYCGYAERRTDEAD